MRNILQVKNWSKKDEVNSRFARSMQDMAVGEEFTANGLALLETDETEDNVTKEVVCFKTTDGDYISTVSPTICKMVYDIMEVIDEEEQVRLKTGKRTSKSGREYLIILMV